MTDFNELRGGLQADGLVDDRYRVIERIGSGGMADVYRAEDNQLHRDVALKVLHRRFAADGEFVERFRREASAAAGLQHPNVVQVFDRGSWDGTYYIAMELLDGQSLKDLVANGPLDPTTAIDITIGLLRALRFAHRRGIVHRDIKPHNVIVDGENRVKVTDFGIARAGASDMTETGAIMGTAAYLSPEQAQGHAVSATSDLYSAGIVLYELLTGRPPFDAESPVSIALKQVSEAPVPPSQINPAVSPELEAVVMCALQKDPANRYQNADEFIAALEEVRAGGGAALDAGPGPLTGVYPSANPVEDGSPPSGVADAAEPAKRRPWWMWLLVAAAVAALAGGLFALAQPARVDVPDVVGKKSAPAAATLDRRGFESEIQMVRSADQPSDEVIRQRPAAGEPAAEGSQVTIYVSSGPGEGSVPDVAGEGERRALRDLRRAGFDPEVRRVYSDTVDAGRVVGTRPGAQSQIDIGSTVIVNVSRGPTLVALPDVVGSQISDARQRLENQGFDVSVTRLASSEDPGTVTAMDPGGGALVQRDSTVILTVAEAADVPSVTGLSEGDARSQLENAGFSVRVQREPVSSADEDGTVLSQDPEGGASRRAGSRVTITVGRRVQPPRPTRSPTPTAEPDETPTPTPTPADTDPADDLPMERGLE